MPTVLRVLSHVTPYVVSGHWTIRCWFILSTAGIWQLHSLILSFSYPKQTSVNHVVIPNDRYSLKASLLIMPCKGTRLPEDMFRLGQLLLIYTHHQPNYHLPLVITASLV